MNGARIYGRVNRDTGGGEIRTTTGEEAATTKVNQRSEIQKNSRLVSGLRDVQSSQQAQKGQLISFTYVRGMVIELGL